MPGGFSSKQFLPKIQSEILDKSNRTKLSLIPRKNSFQLQYFYISRYQEFLIKNFTDNCNGTFKSGSCVFDVGHLPILLVRPELVVHKLYLDIHPASFFCLYQKIRERALDFKNQKNFDASNYENLPQVQLLRGKSINDVQFFF
uniref:Uncharacterized protein n=1 Tax=Panagrolaimus davidi TaxID=227884 RepID=A0A914P0F3_9BILA